MILPLFSENRMNTFAGNTLWSGGQLLAFSGLEGLTDFANGLVLRTGFYRKTSLEIMIPIKGSLVVDPNPPEICRLGSDWVDLQWAEKSFRLVFVDSCNILFEGEASIDIGDGLVHQRRGNRSLISVAGREKTELLSLPVQGLICDRQQWETAVGQRISLPSPQSLPAVGKALTQIKGMIYAPEGRIRHRWSTPDRWPHRKMWLWDSVFHAVGIRHLDLPLARDLISAVFDCQEEDGFIPHMMTPSDSSEITQPPILGLGVSLVLEKDPENSRSLTWMEELYTPLARYLSWLERHRDTDGDGLLEWFIEKHENCRSGESGMDNSARFDRAFQLGAVDFNSYLSLEYDIMSRFAARLGKERDAKKWQEKHRTLNDLLNRFCWDEEKGFYYDYFDVEGTRTSTEAVSGFLPLLCGAANGKQITRLVHALKDPARFGAAFPVPSVSLSDPGYAEDMWRGPTWINMNWLIIRGLTSCGLDVEANVLRTKTRRSIEAMVRRYGTFFEYYDSKEEKDPPALKRKGKCAPQESPYHQVFFDYGWSACLYIDILETSV